MRQLPPPVGADPVLLALAGMRRLAVVGLSPHPWRESHGVAAAAQRSGWTVVPVNPHADEVLGEPAWPDLASVPGRVDAVVVFRRTEHLPDVAAQAVARDDVGVVWNQLGLRSAAAADVVAAADRCYVEDRCLKVEAARRRTRPPAGPRVDGDVLWIDLEGTVLVDGAVAAGSVEALWWLGRRLRLVADRDGGHEDRHDRLAAAGALAVLDAAAPEAHAPADVVVVGGDRAGALGPAAPVGATTVVVAPPGVDVPDPTPGHRVAALRDIA